MSVHFVFHILYRIKIIELELELEEKWASGHFPFDINSQDISPRRFLRAFSQLGQCPRCMHMLDCALYMYACIDACMYF